MEFVAATNNAHKLAEMRRILVRMGHTVLSQREAGVLLEPEETGATFEANAAIKAQAVCEACRKPTIADDSGLCVDALDGAPGIHTARYGGEGLSDQERYTLLLENMKGQMTRAAKFVSVVTCVFPNADVVSARGELFGAIAYAPIGAGGFGYDPVFFVTHMKKTLAQMTMKERQSCSHRAAAIRNLAVKLEEYKAKKKEEGIEWN